MTTDTTPAEAISEREAFEKWCNEQPAPNFSLMPWPRGLRRDDGLYDGPVLIDGEYYAPQTQSAWKGWQARGEYERTRPTPQPDAVEKIREALEVATTPLPEDRQKVIEALALLPTLTAAPEPLSLSEYCKIYREGIDEKARKYVQVHLDGVRAVLTAAKVKWRE